MIIRESKTVEFDDDSIIETTDEAVNNTPEMTLSDMLDQHAANSDVKAGPVPEVKPEGTYTQSVSEDGSVTYAYMAPASDAPVQEADEQPAEAASEPEDQYGDDAGEPEDQYEAPEETIEVPQDETPTLEDLVQPEEAVVVPRYSNSFRRDDYARREREMNAKFVTKKFFAIMMILAVIVSSSLGAAIGGLVISKNNGSGGGGVGSEPSLEAATGSEMTIAQIVDANDDSVVEINTKTQVMSMFGSTEAQGAGSGVIIREDGYIATNFHVIEGSNEVSVRLHNGDEYSAQVVGFDQQNDIAVLKIDGKDFDPAEFGSSGDLAVGDLAVAIGNPLGQLGGTATSGIISSLDRQLEIDGRTLNLLQTDSAINPGNSGGGLFDHNGNLVGIVVAKSSGTGIEGLGFAIPIDTAKPIIDDIVEHGKISTKPAAGIVIAEISEDQLAMYGVDKAGVYITEVNGQNASKAGLESGDRIIKFDGKDVQSSSELVHSIQKHKVGDNVEFVVERDGQQLSIRFDLEDSSKFN